MNRALLISLALLSLPAVAQTRDDSGRKITVIDFDNDVIEGDLNTPDMEVNEVGPRWEHKSLVRVRKTFKARVLGSIAGL